MLKFLLFFITILGFQGYIFADDAKPDTCIPYTTEGEPVKDNKLRNNIPFGKGLFWEIEALTGAKSYIFGTIHSQDRLVTTLPPPVRLKLVKSKKIFMEVIPDQQANEIFTSSMFFDNDKDLKSLLDKDIYAKLERIAPDYGIVTDKVSRLKPWAAFSLIGRPKPVRAATQEMEILQLAKNINLPVTGMESMNDLVNVLDSITLDDQLEILVDTICNHNKIIQQTQDLVEMYIARDLAGMVIFNQQPHHDESVFRRFMQKMVYERNYRIVKNIDRILGEGGAFIAIGAMHLPDENGLLKLLENRDFILRRIY